MDAQRVASKNSFNLNGFTCSFDGCQFICKKQSRLKLHENTHISERPYKCSIGDCSKEYKQSAHLKRHLDSAHKSADAEPVELFRCGQASCEKAYSSVYSLKKHVLRLHTNLKNYVCTTEGCKEAFSKRFQLRRHVFEHKGTLPFQCHHEYCKKTFGQTSHLKRHLKVHEGYNCEIVDCGLHFDKWSSLRKHKAQCHKPVQKCPTCGKVCSSKALLKRHVNIEHSDGCVHLYKCSRDNCTKSYPDLSNLNIHVKSYHETSQFVCTHSGCGRTLSTKQKLGQHVKQHGMVYAQTEKKPRLNLHCKKTALDKLFKVDKDAELSASREEKLFQVDKDTELSANREEKEELNTPVDLMTADIDNDDTIDLGTAHLEEIAYSSELNKVLWSSDSCLKVSSNDVDNQFVYDISSESTSLVEKPLANMNEKCLDAREHIVEDNRKASRDENAASERNI